MKRSLNHILLIKNERSKAKKLVSCLTVDRGFDLRLYDESPDDDFAIELSRNKTDLIILDWDDLSRSGPELCQALREFTQIPIVIITDNISTDSCVDALRAGADDFIRKPFVKIELIERVRALLRRRKRQDNTYLIFKDLMLDQQKKTVSLNNHLVPFSQREYDLLYYFMSSLNTIVTRDMLMEKVWGYDTAVTDNVIDRYISYVRKKIGCHKDNRYIKTVHGRGYIMSE